MGRPDQEKRISHGCKGFGEFFIAIGKSNIKKRGWLGEDAHPARLSDVDKMELSQNQKIGSEMLQVLYGAVREPPQIRALPEAPLRQESVQRRL